MASWLDLDDVVDGEVGGRIDNAGVAGRAARRRSAVVRPRRVRRNRATIRAAVRRRANRMMVANDIAMPPRVPKNSNAYVAKPEASATTQTSAVRPVGQLIALAHASKCSAAAARCALRNAFRKGSATPRGTKTFPTAVIPIRLSGLSEMR